MDIELLLSKHSDNYRFHGAGQFLSSLIAQAENGEMKLYGRSHDDAVDGEEECEWVAGLGYLYVTNMAGIEICYNNFASDDKVVLVLEKQVDEPQEWYPRNADSREMLIRVEEWKVIGAIHPTAFDEDGDVLEDEGISLEDLLSENF
jgi:hypothetical protein